jgi:transcription elongation factor GreA
MASIMNDEKEYLSQEKYDELKKELEFLRSTGRKKVLVDLEYAKSLGDLSENAEYHEARSKQAELEDRVAALEALLKSASIVAHKNTDIASMGSTIVLRKEGEKETRNIEIVGTEEADVEKGKLSNKSPLGQAIMGKKKGDTISFKSPNGETVSYSVIDVH